MASTNASIAVDIRDIPANEGWIRYAHAFFCAISVPDDKNLNVRLNVYNLIPFTIPSGLSKGRVIPKRFSKDGPKTSYHVVC